MSSVPQPSDPTLPAPDAGPEATGPRVYGVVDMLRPDRVAGWAIDRGDRRAALEIEVRREGRLVEIVRADRHRKDLERGGVGTGRYGFVCTLAPPLEPGFEFTVSVTAHTADGITAELRRPSTAVVAGNPDRRIIERIFEEVSRVRSVPPLAEPNSADALLELIRRLEVAQARMEAALGALEAPPAPAFIGLKVLLGVSLAVGLGSLALGLFSMWQP